MDLLHSAYRTSGSRLAVASWLRQPACRQNPVIFPTTPPDKLLVVKYCRLTTLPFSMLPAGSAAADSSAAGRAGAVVVADAVEGVR